MGCGSAASSARSMGICKRAKLRTGSRPSIWSASRSRRASSTPRVSNCRARSRPFVNGCPYKSPTCRRICKAKKIVARLRKRLPGSNRLHQKRRRLAGLELRWQQLKAKRKYGQIHHFFSSKNMFHSQFHLAENGFPSHAEWKQAWSEARSSQFFVLGSKDETAGCQGCGATRPPAGRYYLRVRLPNAARQKHLVIPGVRFRYGQEQLEESLAASRALWYRFLRGAK